MLKILSVVLLAIYYCESQSSVDFAAVIYRHGDRTIIEPYPTDPWGNESLWPTKFGELTNIGKRQHYALGKWLRQRYSNLLSDEFDPSQIYVRSTDVDRTLMSAQANLAGMYPPSGKSVWDTDLMWQPIPVHTVPEKNDNLLAMKKKCMAYDEEYERVIHSEAYKTKLSKYQKLMDYLTAHTGTKIRDFNGINDIYNILYIESLYNFTLPAWTRPVYPDKLKVPACFSFTTQTSTPLLARLKIGPILTEIITKMVDLAINEGPKDRKMYIYSGHDLTVANILNGMGLFDGDCPVYTATLMFELLHDEKTRSHYVRVLYRNSTEIVEPHVLHIPFCGERCSLQKFIDVYSHLLYVKWDAECSTEPPSILGILMLLGLSMVITFYIIRKVHMDRVYHEYGFHPCCLNVVPIQVEKMIEN